MGNYKYYRSYNDAIFDDDKKTVILTGVKDFNITHLFESGQAFRWELNDDGSYTGVVCGRIVNIRQDKDDVFIKNCTKIDFEECLFDYFDLGTDYAAIKTELVQIDEHLERAILFGSGIRIMKQDLWETTVTFILSANNRIPMIKRAVAGICEKYGKPIGEYGGKEFYDFPSHCRLSSLEPSDLRVSGVGFRDKYVSRSADMVNNGDVSLDVVMNSDYAGARDELLKLPGVGDKVADCILLFSKGEMKSYPVDTWVKKLTKKFYGVESEKTADIKRFADCHFKGLQGIAQQYLFYYARETKIK